MTFFIQGIQGQILQFKDFSFQGQIQWHIGGSPLAQGQRHCITHEIQTYL